MPFTGRSQIWIFKKLKDPTIIKETQVNMTDKNTILYIQWGDEGNGVARGIASTWKLLQQQPKPALLPTPRELATPQVIHVVGLRHRNPVTSRVLQMLLILILEEQNSL